MSRTTVSVSAEATELKLFITMAPLPTSSLTSDLCEDKPPLHTDNDAPYSKAYIERNFLEIFDGGI